MYSFMSMGIKCIATSTLVSLLRRLPIQAKGVLCLRAAVMLYHIVAKNGISDVNGEHFGLIIRSKTRLQDILHPTSICYGFYPLISAMTAAASSSNSGGGGGGGAGPKNSSCKTPSDQHLFRRVLRKTESHIPLTHWRTISFGHRKIGLQCSAGLSKRRRDP